MFIYLIQTEDYFKLYAIALLVNLIYFSKFSFNNKFNLNQMVKYILYGENIYSIMYILWLIVFEKKTYVFYVPLVYSITAKIYSMYNPQ